MKRNMTGLTAGTALTVALASSLGIAPAHAEIAQTVLFSHAEMTESAAIDDASLVARLKASAPKDLMHNQVAFVSEAGTAIVERQGFEDVSLNPAIIAACNAGLGDVVVQDFEAAAFGKVSLKCGDDRAGYVHIRKEHEKDWQTVVDLMGGGALWDDFMVYSTNAALAGPSATYPRDVGNNKWCYTTPVVVVTRNGEDVFRPSIYVSVNNRIVITSFPTKTPNC